MHATHSNIVSSLSQFAFQKMYEFDVIIKTGRVSEQTGKLK